MLLLKNDYTIPQQFLSDLSTLIGGKVNMVLSSRMMTTDQQDSPAFFSDIAIIIEKNESSRLLYIQPFFAFNKIISNEIANLVMSLQNPIDTLLQPGNNSGFNVSIRINNQYIIERIKIYGEERTAIWSELRKFNYFEQKIDSDVSDYLFNNLSIRLECEHDRHIDVSIDRESLLINFDKQPPVTPSYYLKSDLHGEEDFSDGEVWSNVEKIKCHYEIDKDSIRFFRRMGEAQTWPTGDK